MIKLKVLMIFGIEETWTAQKIDPIELPYLLPDMEIGLKGKDTEKEDIVGFVRLQSLTYDTTGNYEARIWVTGPTTICECLIRAGGWKLINFHPEFGNGVE